MKSCVALMSPASHSRSSVWTARAHPGQCVISGHRLPQQVIDDRRTAFERPAEGLVGSVSTAGSCQMTFGQACYQRQDRVLYPGRAAADSGRVHGLSRVQRALADLLATTVEHRHLPAKFSSCPRRQGQGQRALLASLGRERQEQGRCAGSSLQTLPPRHH